MTEFLWQLPSRGDGRHATPGTRNRGGFGGPQVPTVATDLRPGNFGPFDDLAQIVLAAELSGLDGVLAPYDPLGEESWIVGGGALRDTRHARVIVEFQPAFGTPVYAAKVSATLQRLSAGRLAWRIQVETDEADARARGDRVTGADRYARAAEFLAVARGVWNETPLAGAGFKGTDFHFAGEYFDVVDGGFRGILSGLPFHHGVPVRFLGRGAGPVGESRRRAPVHRDRRRCRRPGRRAYRAVLGAGTHGARRAGAAGHRPRE